MRKYRVLSFISQKQYEAFKSLALEDMDLPDRYEDWLEMFEDRASALIKSGIHVEKVEIDVKDFQSYCANCSIHPDGIARDAFAVHTYCPENSVINIRNPENIKTTAIQN